MNRRKLHGNWVFAAILVAAVPTVRAQTPEPIGAQFPVNSYTTGSQSEAVVAVDGAGKFVVVWSSFGSDNGDTDGFSVQGQRFDADGSALGAPLLINSYTTNFQNRPEVAVGQSGDFVVVWQSIGSDGGDTSGYSIQAQRFDASGGAVGAQFQVNSYTTGNQALPRVAVGGSGDFVVVWHSDGSDEGDTSDHSIQGQRFDAGGGAVGAQFQVNSYTTGRQASAAVAVDESGFVVVWQSLGSSNGDTSGYSIQGQRFDASGGAVGSQFLVNSYTTSSQVAPAVGVDGSGDCVVVWSSNGADDDDVGFSTQGQVFDSGGVAVGSQFLVNSYTTSDQFLPAVAVDPSGGFVVVWESYGADNGAPSDEFSIQGQRFAEDGSALGAQFLVNSYTTGSQFFPDIGMDASGDFVVVWDQSGLDVAGRRFKLNALIFIDGFESGDVTAWSASVS